MCTDKIPFNVYYRTFTPKPFWLDLDPQLAYYVYFVVDSKKFEVKWWIWVIIATVFLIAFCVICIIIKWRRAKGRKVIY